jgi:hypothetical protein
MKSMLLKPESGTLRQYFTGPIGVEYLVRGKKLSLLAIDRDLTRSIALNFLPTVVCFPLLPLLDVRAAFLDAFVRLLS